MEAARVSSSRGIPKGDRSLLAKRQIGSEFMKVIVNSTLDDKLIESRIDAAGPGLNSSSV